MTQYGRLKHRGERLYSTCKDLRRAAGRTGLYWSREVEFVRSFGIGRSGAFSVLVVGAGIPGMVLATACEERDDTPTSSRFIRTGMFSELESRSRGPLFGPCGRSS
jgi:hypothetical protein